MKRLGVALMVAGLGIMAILWGGQTPSMGEDPNGNAATSNLLYAGGIWAGLLVAVVGGLTLAFGKRGRTPPV
jgi:hypothetical protein